MKSILKKITGMIMGFMMIVSLVMPAAAQGNNGTITIENAVDKQTYTIYKILNLSHSGDAEGAHSYTVNEKWSAFMNGDDVKNVYFTIDESGYVSWKEGVDTGQVAEFAKKALAYAQEHKIQHDGQRTADASGKVTFSNLPLGYYLVDSSLGSLCSLDSTNTTVTIKDKNGAPTLTKEVQENSTSQWGNENDANIGDIVKFRTTIVAKKGAQNYIVHDKMSSGLTLASKDTNPIIVKEKATNTILTRGTEFEVHVNEGGKGSVDQCTFHVEFKQTYLDTITEDTDLVIEYAAELNENSLIYGESNTNESFLSYGDSSKTSTSITNTYTFEFDLVKTDANGKVLDGAQFELYDAKTNGNKISFVKKGNGVYRVASSNDVEKTTVIIPYNGVAKIEGLDGGKTGKSTIYYLDEIVAPEGYNKLSERQEIIISDRNIGTDYNDGIGGQWVNHNGGVQVINKSGAELPSTGGMGLTLIYGLGAILVIGAGIILVTNKRVKKQ